MSSVGRVRQLTPKIEYKWSHEVPAPPITVFRIYLCLFHVGYRNSLAQIGSKYRPRNRKAEFLPSGFSFGHSLPLLSMVSKKKKRIFIIFHPKKPLMLFGIHVKKTKKM